MVLHPSFHVVIQVSCNPPKSIVRSGGKIRVIFVSWGGGFDFPIFFLVVTAAAATKPRFFFGTGLLREMCRGVFPKIVEMLCVCCTNRSSRVPEGCYVVFRMLGCPSVWSVT